MDESQKTCYMEDKGLLQLTSRQVELTRGRDQDECYYS